MRLVRLTLPALMLALLPQLACTSVTPVTNEQTGPTVVFRQGNATITSASLNADGATPLNINCVATDNGGVQAVSLTFSTSVSNCTTTAGNGYTGSFAYSPPPPATQTTTSHPDSNGQVPTELFLIGTMNGGAYSCMIPDVTGPARPYGQTVTATCTAQNYSAKSTTATLPIVFSPWP